jgi:hypothetical protein
VHSARWHTSLTAQKLQHTGTKAFVDARKYRYMIVLKPFHYHMSSRAGEGVEACMVAPIFSRPAPKLTYSQTDEQETAGTLGIVSAKGESCLYQVIVIISVSFIH